MNKQKKFLKFLPRFGMRTLFLFLFIASLFCAWFIPLYVRSQREARLLREIVGLKPVAFFDYHYVDVKGQSALDEFAQPPGPKLLLHYLGENLFAHVQTLSVSSASDRPEVEAEALQKIGGFRDLESLYIEGRFSLDDLSFCRNLGDLKQLHMRRVESENFDDIERLQNLKELALVNCVGPKDLSAISQLANVEKLTLNLNNFKDYSFVSAMPKLKTLYFQHPYSSFTDWAWLGQLKNVEQLYVRHCEIRKLPALDGLKNLKYLEIDHCHMLKSTLPIVGLKNLEILKIGEMTPLQILDVIDQLPKLKRLEIRREKPMATSKLDEVRAKIPHVEVDFSCGE